MTTMASSTRMPSTNTSEKRTTIFNVIPSAERMTKPTNIDNGIAVEMRSEFLNPKNMKRDMTTRNIPVRMLFSSSFTMRVTNFDWSLEISSLMPFGNCACLSLTIFFTSSAIRSRFSPARFRTAIETTSTPLSRAYVCRSSNE